MSKLTIIIPILERPQYIVECLDSIAIQNQHNIDVMLVCDADYEGMQEEMNTLATQYASMFPVRYIQSLEEHGLSAARNYGMMNCQSEYVYFMDPDDTLAPGTLSAYLEAVVNLPVDVVYSKVLPMHRLMSGYHEEYEEEVQLLKETDSTKLSQRPVMDQTLANFEKPAASYMVQMRDDLEDFTVLGCMFYRNFLKENDILFANDIKLYPDAAFICKALVNAEECKRVDEGAYIRRNGTFRYSFERKQDWKTKLKDYMKSYDLAYSYCISNVEMMVLVQETMCSRYVNVVIRQICKSKDEQWQKEIYDIFAKQIKRVDKHVIQCFDATDRKHLTLLLKGDLKHSIAYMTTYVKRKKREFAWKKKSNWLRQICEKLFGRMDILERYIVFESGKGLRYYGDPKYIYRYLQEHHPGEYKCIWVANNSDLASRIDGNCTTVKRLSFRYYYYILRAKYWVKDTRQPVWWFKAKEQRYISTWMGTPMQKLFLDKQAFHDGPSALLRGLKAQVDQWDLVISGNADTSAILKSGMGVKEEQIAQIGNPRNDLLLAPGAAQRSKELRGELGIPANKKTILYAPVWREEEETDVSDCYKLQLGLYRMREQLGDEYVVLLRFHDYITGRVILDKALEGFIYDFSFYDDIQELLLISDILVTDYSSIIFDYACLNRPMLFYLYDYERYCKDKEHFYFAIEADTAPGPLCYTTQEVITHIKELPAMTEAYQQRYEAFHDRFCNYTYGSAERLARAAFTEMQDVFEYMDSNKG